jgi:hypothetical protein
MRKHFLGYKEKELKLDCLNQLSKDSKCFRNKMYVKVQTLNFSRQMHLHQDV